MTRTGSRTRRTRVAMAALATAGLLGACNGSSEPEVTIGLITKQEDNAYWVKMRSIAEDTADDLGATLLTATGTSDVDVAAQEQALRSMVEDGAQGILITPNDSSALNGVIAEIREGGVPVIALDTPVEPADAVDAYYGTDNLRAGQLIGQYAAAKVDELGLDPKIALLDLAPDIISGEERLEGFLEGFGIAADDAMVVGREDTEGNRELGEAAMATILAATPDVNVVYTVNERAALGALVALEDAGANLDEVVVVSIDGGCDAIKDAVRPGRIDATSMQFPENMAREGVRDLVAAARGGETPTGYLDTGVELITGDPATGVDARDVAYGVRNCWGD